ncbi:jg23468 [Pararge aegeria aegeria]|uniref:Jg23468 protein n=1 Tax=Pararge aegeria aegeria TaxID=348720 RepID=A0A8S4S1E5_9NEOP|nr:jg23468 [Pararge aegeria aegeria]
MAPEIKYNKIFIDNQWVEAEDINAAVKAAKRAFHRNSEWRLMDASQRGKILNKFADLVERDADYLAELETYNNGMVLSMCRRFIGASAYHIRYNASLADKIQGSTIPCDGDAFSYTLKQPVGVCGLILPWNVPMLMFISKVTTALAAGCTVVVKPAEQTPLTALALAALLAEAGMPPGVVNVVPGFGETAGATLTHHPDVALISFTGSLEVGKLIQQAAGTNNLKRVVLELGGKSPLVIMNDADHETMMNKVLGYIEKGKSEGAKLLTGGKRIGTTGFYIEPAVFADVKDDMAIAKEEIFGPVQSIFKFNTLEEAIDRANATNYGLAAGIFTSSIETALQFSKHVEAGNVWVNTYLHHGPQLPFGGFKESGIGRENGLDAVNSYLEVKTVTISLPKKV